MSNINNNNNNVININDSKINTKNNIIQDLTNIDKQLIKKYKRTKKDIDFLHYLLDSSNHHFYLIVKNLLL